MITFNTHKKIVEFVLEIILFLDFKYQLYDKLWYNIQLTFLCIIKEKIFRFASHLENKSNKLFHVEIPLIFYFHVLEIGLTSTNQILQFKQANIFCSKREIAIKYKSAQPRVITNVVVLSEGIRQLNLDSQGWQFKSWTCDNDDNLLFVSILI